MHFNRPFPIMPSPLIVATALAERTRRIRLRLAVALLSLQHLLRTAEDAATVDLLSNGRLAVGGWGAAQSPFISGLGRGQGREPGAF